LREAHEEVGLDPSSVTIVGELSHVNTVVSMSYIIPKVGLLDAPVPLAPQTMEADKVMWVPLAELTATGTYHGELWGSSPTDRLLHFFELADETVWGATGRMLVDLLVRLYSPSV
jgi:8-oxo-dGTP pyrophosphatase MutT (NUDIX family)